MKKVFIIAEAGVNHNGDIEIAKKLIDEASLAGADAIKFQTFKAERLLTKYADKASYQKNNTDTNETQYEMIKKLELSYDEHIDLLNYSKDKKILFLSSAFDLESIDFLNDVGLEIFKIPSGEITNYPYLKKIGSLRKSIILSTGMSTIDEIEDAIKTLKISGSNDITVLHCNTEYPTPMKDVNLNAMKTIKRDLNVKVGYSDHTLGIEVPIAAVALGAIIIEKHFTLDRLLEGPDHKASLEPNELKMMVSSIRNIELAMGNGKKEPSKSEIKNREIARKSIVASKDIKKGEIFSNDNLDVKRPGRGINPMLWNEIIGKTAKKDFKEDELIEI